MATVANFGTSFDATKFRTAITQVMTMGLPQSTPERATFRWTVEKTFQAQDTKNRPYEWDSTPVTTVAPPDVQIPVAVEFKPGFGEAGFSQAGQVEDVRVVLTVLDTYFPQVEGASHVDIGDDLYRIMFVAPPIGLFSVTVYQIYCGSIDEH
jgi:hypothetical protein